MKPVDDGIARRYTHNDLVGTVGDFPLPKTYTNVPPLKEIQEVFLRITHY